MTFGSVFGRTFSPTFQPKSQAVSAGAWTPRSISGCLLWLDFSDTDTLFTDAGSTKVVNDGDLIYQANDKSGNSNHATQATESKRLPYKVNIQNSLGAALGTFGSTAATYMTHPVLVSDPTALTLFFAATKATSPAANLLWAHRSETTRLIQLNIENNSKYTMQLRGSGNILQAVSNTSCDTTLDAIYTAKFDKTNDSHYVWFNTSASAENTYDFGSETFTSTKDVLFASYNGSTYASSFGGYVYEVIIYNSALSDTDRGKVETYLNNKWAIY